MVHGMPRWSMGLGFVCVWVHPLLCRHVQRAVIVSPSKAFQAEVTQLTGVPRHHQRLRFGFPASKVLGAIGQLSDSLQVGCWWWRVSPVVTIGGRVLFKGFWKNLHRDPCGDDPIWRAYFFRWADGFKPPTASGVVNEILHARGAC